MDKIDVTKGSFEGDLRFNFSFFHFLIHSIFYCSCFFLRCLGVLSTLGGIAGVGLGYLPRREHESTSPSGGVASRGAIASSRENVASLDWIVVAVAA